MRIAIFDKTEPTGFGGFQTFSNRLNAYLRSQDHDVYFFRYSNDSSTDPHVISLPYYIREPRTYVFVPSLHLHRIVVENFKKIQPDLIYLYIGLSPFDFILPSVAKKFRIPLAGVWHADYNPSINAMQLLIKAAFLYYMPLCRKLSLLHVFSEKMKQFHVNHGVSEKNILVLPNGVDARFYSPGPSQFAKDHGIKTGILFLGRLSVQKNPVVLLTSFLSLNPSDDTKLVMVGGGDLEQSLRKRFRDPRIIFTGAILNNQRKRDIIRACQIFIQPSLMEGVSLALLESLSCGLTAITSDAGSNETLLRGAGTILPIATLPTELPKRLSEYLRHPDRVQRMRKQARQTVLRDFTEEKIYGKLLQAFEATILRQTALS